MASLTERPNPLGAFTKALAAFLQANIAQVGKVYDGWPATNQKLVMPAVSIFVKTPQFKPLNPYIVNQDPLGNHTASIRRCVGMYDLELQLDMWTAYKSQRDSMLGALIEAFNKNSEVPGIDLTLSDYYDEKVHVSLYSTQYVEDEQAVERGEWRALSMCVANVRVMTSETNFLIETIENNLEIPLSIPVAE